LLAESVGEADVARGVVEAGGVDGDLVPVKDRLSLADGITAAAAAPATTATLKEDERYGDRGADGPSKGTPAVRTDCKHRLGLGGGFF
jgi:hypothetical protein